MKLIALFVVILSFIQVYAQPENRLQPDSIYQNKKVKKIYAYLNSKKDLSEVIEFNSEGYKIRSVKYSASYNKKTRKSKRIDMIAYFKYDPQMRLAQVTDSIYATANNLYFYYDQYGALDSTKYFRSDFKTPDYETWYYTNPYRSTTIQWNNRSITYCKTKEYEKGFYVSRFYGYYLEAKLKTLTSVLNGDTSRLEYSDYAEMIRYEDSMVLNNVYDSTNRLIKSTIKSVFMNDRVREYKLAYTYYPNGLLKSIRGYIPEFFKYEFY